ncbi:MAG: pyridoxine 5-phosphate oxidase [Pseudomonadota bacterium]
MTQDLSAADFMGAKEPFDLFEQWFADAQKHEINDPNAMSLATVDASGLPNVRIVLLKGLDARDLGDQRGFVFYTNFQGTKGQELLASGKAALNFHWKSLRRQVRIRGTVTAVTAAEADAYYKTRPRLSRIGAWASEQSRPLDERTTLEDRVSAFDLKFPGDNIPRPAHWSGFRVTPLSIEFWHDRPFRLHDRLVFARSKPGMPWSTERLYP